MELTPEEKRKIYLEEKERIEAQEKIKKELEQEKVKANEEKRQKIRKQNRVGCLIGVGGVIITAVVLILIYGGDDLFKSSPSADLKINVTFTGSQFIFKNNNTFSYYDAVITINDKYMLYDVSIDAGETYTVSMSEFADIEGNRFSNLQKPQEFNILCKTSIGKSGFYSGKFK